MGFYWVLMGCYWVLLGLVGFYWILLGFTGFYWVLLGFTGFYWVLLGFTEFYWALLASSSWKAKHRFKKKFVDGLIVFRIVLIGKIDRIANVYRRTLSSIGSKT